MIKINVKVFFEFIKTKNNLKIYNLHTVSQNATKQSPCIPSCQELFDSPMNMTRECMVWEFST